MSEQTLRKRLHALAADWHSQADADDRRLKQYHYGGPLDGDMLDEDVELGHQMAAQKRACALELLALLVISCCACGRAPATEEGRDGQWRCILCHTRVGPDDIVDGERPPIEERPTT